MTIKQLAATAAAVFCLADSPMAADKSALMGWSEGEYVLVENASHGDIPWLQEPVVSRVVRFFQMRFDRKPAESVARK